MRGSRTRYIVLGVLTLGPKSGYDIKKYIESSVRYFWRESYGQIYPTLRQLADEGLVSRRVEGQEGKPDRYVYKLTSGGRAALRDWLKRPPEPEVPRHELLLKLFFGTELSPEANLRHVARYRSEIEQYIDLLKRGERQLRKKYGDSERSVYLLLTIAQGILVDKALLKWCKHAENELQKLIDRQEGARRKNRERRARSGERSS